MIQQHVACTSPLECLDTGIAKCSWHVLSVTCNKAIRIVGFDKRAGLVQPATFSKLQPGKSPPASWVGESSHDPLNAVGIIFSVVTKQVGCLRLLHMVVLSFIFLPPKLMGVASCTFSSHKPGGNTGQDAGLERRGKKV